MRAHINVVTLLNPLFLPTPDSKPKKGLKLKLVYRQELFLPDPNIGTSQAY